MQIQGDLIETVLHVLRERRGYFVFFDETGEEYVIARKQDFDERGQGRESEKQLSLPTAAAIARAVEDTAQRLETSPEEVMERINREIALAQEEENSHEFDDLALPAEPESKFSTHISPPRMPGKKVRFEAIKGDLPPELQE